MLAAVPAPRLVVVPATPTLVIVLALVAVVLLVAARLGGRARRGCRGRRGRSRRGRRRPWTSRLTRPPRRVRGRALPGLSGPGRRGALARGAAPDGVGAAGRPPDGGAPAVVTAAARRPAVRAAPRSRGGLARPCHGDPVVAGTRVRVLVAALHREERRPEPWSREVPPGGAGRRAGAGRLRSGRVVLAVADRARDEQRAHDRRRRECGDGCPAPSRLCWPLQSPNSLPPEG